MLGSADVEGHGTRVQRRAEESRKVIWEAAHSPVPLLAETKHPPGRETRMGSPSLLLMPSHVPVLTRSIPLSTCSVGTGQRTTGAEQAGGLHGQCQAVLCLTASCRLHLLSHTLALSHPWSVLHQTPGAGTAAVHQLWGITWGLKQPSGYGRG